MTARVRRNVAVAVATLAALVCSAPAQAAPVSIRSLAAEEVHLATIAYRMSAASAGLCPKPEMMTGMLVHDLTQYDASLRPAVSSAFSLHGGFGVLAIVPGSTAAAARLQVDDEILRVGGFSVEDARAVSASPKSYRRMDTFATALQAALKGGSTELVVRRNGNLMRVQLNAQAGCGGRFTLASSTELNAWSDGSHVVVTTKMAGMAANDNEIAFVIAHEMAHNILGHSDAARGHRGFFGGIADARRSEIEADTFAVTLEASAGYDPAGGIAFLEGARRRLWWAAMSLDHPGFGRRIQAVNAAIAAFAANQRQSSLKMAALEPPTRARAALQADSKSIAQKLVIAQYVPVTSKAPLLRTFGRERTACDY